MTFTFFFYKRLINAASFSLINNKIKPVIYLKVVLFTKKFISKIDVMRIVSEARLSQSYERRQFQKFVTCKFSLRLLEALVVYCESDTELEIK